MGERTSYAPGTFCWVDLATTDAAGAKGFYMSLFGWDVTDVPVGSESSYSMFNIDGKDVAALYGMGEQQREQGMAPHWLSYVSVESADAAAKRADALGGRVVSEPFDVFDVGRMAVLEDPSGAVFAVWEPRRHIGARLVNQPGTLCWNELATPDSRAAKSFYTGLFGWTAAPSQSGAGAYTEFRNGDRPAAGMLALTPGRGEAPAHWLPYFAVSDCDESVERARALGASVQSPPTNIPAIGRYAVLQDPQGAAFAIIRLNETPD